MIDYLIVGAGLFGAVCARELTDAGKRVLVIEKRDHVGGMVHTERVDGILVQKHGGHIFHTDSKRLWDYVNRFATFRQYEHRVKAFYKGVVYSFPPNLMTCQQLGVKAGTKEAEQALKETFFEGYTAKQWGKPLSEVPASVIKRIPIRHNWDDRYFSDEYQGMPVEGYTEMVEAMLDGVHVELRKDAKNGFRTDGQKVVFTGPLDEFFHYRLGRLDYRSLRFEHERIEQRSYQGCATMNYTDVNVPYTRILEHKYFYPANVDHTLITREYPERYDGSNEPYYPIEDAANRGLYNQYRAMADSLSWLHLGGRMAEYRYYDMHQVIASALNLCKKLCG